MKEQVSNETIRIENFAAERDVVSTAQLYAEVFAGPPWNEFTYCGACEVFYGLQTQPGDACETCQNPLAEAYPLESTVEYITKESNRPDSIVKVAKEGNETVGFAWGFSYSSCDEFANEKYHTPQMQDDIKDVLKRNNIQGPFFYFSECGVQKDKRGKGLSNILAASLSENISGAVPIVMRTNWQSPMMAVANRLGMTQIMGPQVEVDRNSRSIRPTGDVIEMIDTENQNRVLFMMV